MSLGSWSQSRGVKPEACKGCPRFERGQGFVPGDGPPDSPIALVGRSPGKAEASVGRPYSGGAGHLLTNILDRAGLPRSSVYITNLVKCYSEGEPTGAEIAFCKAAYLDEELNDRKVIAAVGSLPGRTLARIDKVKRERGTIHVIPEGQAGAGTPVVVTLEPAGLIWSRSEAKNIGEKRDYLPIVIKDFVKVKRLATDQAIVTQDRVLDTAPTSETIANVIARAIEKKKYALDLETAFHRDDIADDENEAVVEMKRREITIIGLSADLGHAISIKNWRFYREQLQALFDVTDAVMVVHNAQFDPWVLRDNGFEPHNRVYDTMLADHLVESDMGDFGLEAVISRHTDYEPWKEEFRGDPSRYWLNRNVKDVEVTLELEHILTGEMRENGVESLFWKHQMPMADLCARMKRTGIKVDEEAMARYRLGCMRVIAKMEETLSNTVGTDFNWRSSKQLKELLYEVLKMPVQLHRRTRKPTTDHYALEDLNAQTGSKLVETILELKKIDKLVGTFLSGSYTVNGRVHPDYLQHRAVTGRLSSVGPNMQQVPKGIARSMFVPDSADWIFIEADFSQIEMRLAAWFANCTKMIAMFADGIDIHVRNAQRFYGTPEITPTQRSLAKNMFYGIMYGQGKHGLSVMYGVDETYASNFINFIFGEYPELRWWRDGLLNTIDDRNYLRNPYGRIRWLWNRSFATEAYIYLPQSTGADVLYESMLELDRRLPAPARIVLPVHDSILVTCPAEQRDEIVALMKSIMSSPKEALGGYEIPVKLGAGQSYDEASREEGLAGDWRRLRRTVR